MGRATKVPITPEVLGWAVAESGYGPDEIARAIHVPPQAIRAWIEGTERPSLGEARALATKLRRPLAVFLLPDAPRSTSPAVEFRRLPGSDRRELNPEERNALRDAVRVQRIVSWALQESRAETVSLPAHRISDDAEAVANSLRDLLAIPSDVRLGWRSPPQALAGWRAALEQIGVLVFLLPMGRSSCRGFSVWDEHAPLIVANTWWNPAARSFTLIHELAHLVTRTSSACLGPGVPPTGRHGDATERWCEAFAAAVLLPAHETERHLEEDAGWQTGEKITDLQPVAKIARRMNVSLRAATLRLIKMGIARPQLYGTIAPASDHKRRGGGGDGRRRHQARHDQLGTRTVRVMLEAVNSGVLTTSDALGYLDLGHADLGPLSRDVRRAAGAL